jgi:hypothetical protein
MSFFDDKITKNVADVAAKIMNTKPVVEDKKPDIVIEPITKDAKLIKENKNIKKGKIFSIITEKVENKLKSSEQSEHIVENVVNKLRKESFSDLISIYKNKGFKGLNETITEEVDNETFTKEIKDQQENSEGKKKKKIANAADMSVVIQKEESLEEKELTPEEKAKKEKIVMSMKKNFGDFKKRYGDKAKEVMYATATDKAKED